MGANTREVCGGLGVFWRRLSCRFHSCLPLVGKRLIETARGLIRRAAGQAGYDGGFVEHYLIPLIYPAGLTPQVQLWLGALVLLVNGAVYGWLLWRWRRRP